ncbi:MAG TPA: hypothetical protein VLN47_05365 [Clostridiaceae bacterium]|nr:hypothetical protein [Clostridiaceae bacterium]
MKKYVVPVVLTVLVVMQAVSLSTISGLRDQLEETNRQLSQVSSEQSRIMGNIYSNVDNLLKRQASIIDTYDYSLGEADRENLAVPITVRVTPKETRTETAATLYLSGKSIVMERSGTTFEGTLPVDIFDTIEAKVVFADEGVERSEKLDIWENLRERALPSLYAQFEGESGYHQTTGSTTGTYTRKGNLNLDIKQAVRSEFREIRLILELDGEVVSDKPVENMLRNRVMVDEKVSLSPGQTSAMRIIAEDSLGLIHKLTIDEVEIDENGQPVFGEFWGMGGEAVITDKDGKVLYEPEHMRFN